MDVLIVAKVANIVGRGVKSLSWLYPYSEENNLLGCLGLSFNSFFNVGSKRILLHSEMRFEKTNWNR